MVYPLFFYLNLTIIIFYVMIIITVRRDNMKKGYFEVLVSDTKNNAYIPIMCEAVCKTVNSHKIGTYIFRDLITQKIIFPNYGSQTSADFLTYDNYSKESHREVSSKKVLDYLKGLDMDKIDMHAHQLHKIENHYVEKSLVRKIES